MPMTPEQQAAWRKGTLDARCRSCGETMPARRVCYHCRSTDLEYREHVEWPGKVGPRPVQWCEQRRYYPETDQSRPMSRTQRAARGG